MRFILPLLITLALASAPSFASIVQNLYSGSVPVTSQGDQARTEALQTALQQVVVKMTGSRAALDDPKVTAITAQPERYLQSYRYKRHIPGQDSAFSGFGLSTRLVLVAHFNRQALVQALRAADQPLWGRERPETLVWIAYKQTGGQRGIVNAGVSGPIRQGVEQAARARGVPIIFPLMDIKDRSIIGFSDIWGQFTSVVEQASQRYQPDAILVGRIDTSGSGASAHWTLIVDGQTNSWSGSNSTAKEAANAGFQHLADMYASRFAIRSGDATVQQTPALNIVVAGIQDARSYARALQYLRSLNILNNVEPMKLDNGTMTFTASARGSVNDVKRTIVLGSVLKAADNNQNVTQVIQQAPPVLPAPSTTSGVVPVLPVPSTVATAVTLDFDYQP